MTRRELERLLDLLAKFSETTWTDDGETRDLIGRLRHAVDLRLEEAEGQP